MNNYEKGKRQEQLAAHCLEQQGYHILAHNYRCHCGEIDLIAKQGKYLVFVEVKYRATIQQGYPQEAVNYHKQQRIYRSALYYMLEFAIPDNHPCRFDVVSITGENTTIIQNAFGGI